MTGSPMFAGATPIPLPLANAALKAMEVLRGDPSLRCRLSHNANYVKTALRSRGLSLPQTPAPIVSLFPRAAAEIARMSKHLLSRGVFPSFIHYPGGTDGRLFSFRYFQRTFRKATGRFAGGAEDLSARKSADPRVAKGRLWIGEHTARLSPLAPSPMASKSYGKCMTFKDVAGEGAGHDMQGRVGP